MAIWNYKKTDPNLGYRKYSALLREQMLNRSQIVREYRKYRQVAETKSYAPRFLNLVEFVQHHKIYNRCIYVSSLLDDDGKAMFDPLGQTYKEYIWSKDT